MTNPNPIIPRSADLSNTSFFGDPSDALRSLLFGKALHSVMEAELGDRVPAPDGMVPASVPSVAIGATGSEVESAR